jgi:anti-sigma factor RsiW
MKHDSVPERLRETLWHRPLTDAETTELRAWLATHPDAPADWAAEQQLSRALHRLANAPVSSNFTARVLQAVERDTSAAHRPVPPAWRGWWRALGWVPKLATACVVLGLSVLSLHQYQAANRERMAQSVAVLTEAGPLPSPEVLQDFDTISRLAQTPPADEELLALLQ